ncbi:hypothetical protein DI09_608p10, partial [Mitosporidium daphniae]
IAVVPIPLFTKLVTKFLINRIPIDEVLLIPFTVLLEDVPELGANKFVILLLITSNLVAVAAEILIPRVVLLIPVTAKVAALESIILSWIKHSVAIEGEPVVIPVIEDVPVIAAVTPGCTENVKRSIILLIP